MRVHLGYVAIALNLPKTTSSSNITFKRYSNISTSEEKLNKLKSVTLSNLIDLKKILEYNIENEIHFYRLTSALIPLATHPDVSNWPYRKIFEKDFKHIGEFITKNHLRIDSHPDQFNVINSLREDVVENTKKTLSFQANLFEDMNYPKGKMVIHVGSSQGGKDDASQRFINNFKNFPEKITSKIILENDDKSFTSEETLKICKALNIPMVLDVHHHMCNNGNQTLEYLLEEILNTWENEILPPKVHFSSPKNGYMDRKHADFINAYDFIEFINLCKVHYDKDLDVMLEAKQKDLSLFKLAEDIKQLEKNWQWIDNSTFEV